jgi:hypothetical protein
MSRINRSAIIRLLVIGSGIVVPIFQGCYHGAGQSEVVEIKQTVFSPTNQVAMIVREMPPGPLDGPSYFVFINDRPYTMPELRQNLFALGAVFMVGKDNFVIGWTGPTELTITCHDCGITKNLMQTQKFAHGDVTIKYVDFP